MATTKECYCGRSFVRGFKALVSVRGRLVRRLVCRRCASSAERIIATTSNALCAITECDERPQMCNKHVSERITEARATALGTAMRDVAGKIAAMKATVKKGDADDHVNSMIEGLEAAFTLMKRSI